MAPQDRPGAFSPPVVSPTGPPWTYVQLIRAGFSTPRQWFGRDGVARSITSIVWHSMEGWLAGAIATWNTGAAGAHLCVLRNGTVVLTCDLANIAWHAGTDYLTGRTNFWRRTNINEYSIGVELEGFHDRGFTLEQAAACRRISDWGTAEYGILREHTFDQISGHHLHSEISNQRQDPGPYWDWSWVGIDP